MPLIDGGTVRLPRLIGQSRALDLILTGRPVDAQEAYQMGLANRVVPKGGSRQAAIELAEELAHFPQTCMRLDRLSVYQQWDLLLKDALKNEFEQGVTAVYAEGIAGAKKFSDGAGRHGTFK